MAGNRTLQAYSSLLITPQIAYRGKVPAWACDMTTLPPFTTWWEVEAGQVEVRMNRGTWKVEAGYWILLPQGQRRRQIIRPGTRLTSLSVRAIWPNGRPLFAHLDPVVAPAGVSPGREARGLCAQLRREAHTVERPLLQHETTPGNWLALQGRLYRFLAGLAGLLGVTSLNSGGATWGHPVLDALLEELQTAPRIGPLPYARWEKQHHLSRTTLDRLARRHLGGSLSDHRDHFLAGEIQRRLIHLPVRAKELAADYGFHDAAHFSRWVRQHLGESPRRMRQMHL